jgi:hypothetical protein
VTATAARITPTRNSNAALGNFFLAGLFIFFPVFLFVAELVFFLVLVVAWLLRLALGRIGGRGAGVRLDDINDRIDCGRRLAKVRAAGAGIDDDAVGVGNDQPAAGRVVAGVSVSSTKKPLPPELESVVSRPSISIPPVLRARKLR